MRTSAKYWFLAFTLLCGLARQAHAQGGVPLWTNYPGGTAIAVDGSGNVVVTGSSGNDYATVAYSSAGVPLWTNRYDGPGTNSLDSATAVAVDASGNVFVTGASRGTNTAYGASDYATVAYSSAGAPLWTNRYHSPRAINQGGRSIAVGSNGNVFVTGDAGTVAYSNSGLPLWTNSDISGRAVTVDSVGNAIATGYPWSGSNYDYYTTATVKYSGAGTPLWANASSILASAIAVGNDGNVYVAGPYDYATLAYSSAGVPLWTNLHNLPGNSYNSARGIAADNSGNVFVTGFSGTNTSYDDYITIRYSGAGVALWTNYYNAAGNSDDRPVAIAVDSSGNVFVTGQSYNGDSFTYATVGYSHAGVPLWSNFFSGYQPNSIAVDRSGNVFVTGDSATIKYSSSIRPLLSMQKLSAQTVLTWTNSAFTLQSAPSLTATFTNIPGATSPFTNPITGPRQFFRLRAN